ncbi:TPA: hypothetical protein ACH3X2_008704 [Trebouxia sp. C0005]
MWLNVMLHEDECNAESSARLHSLITVLHNFHPSSVCVCSLGHVLWLIFAHLTEWNIADTDMLHSAAVLTQNYIGLTCTIQFTGIACCFGLVFMPDCKHQ